MDYREVLKITAKITALDPRWRGETDEDVLAQVRAWTEVLVDVPWWFADAEVTRYYGTDAQWQIRPGQMREAWLVYSREHAEESTDDERACAWARWCECGHLDGACNRGWLDDPEHRDGSPARCPGCTAARDRKRAEARAHA